MKLPHAARSIAHALLGLLGLLPLLAFGQGSSNSSVTTSTSSQTGPINAQYVVLEDTIGPQTIIIGSRTGCTLVPPPTLANCNPTSGTGTPGDPYQCLYLPTAVLVGCSGGTIYNVVAGTTNANAHVQTVSAVAATPGAAQPVPLGPWVPIGSAIGVGLLALLRQRRAARAGDRR